MSKALKTVITVAVGVAIPFVAPMIAGSAALAGVVGTIGTTATSALVGAGINAATAAALGGNVERAALTGGIGGGMGGYFNAPGMPSAPSAPTATAASGAPMSVPSQTVFDPTSGAFVQQAVPQMSYAPGTAPVMLSTGNLAPQIPGLLEAQTATAGLSGLSQAMAVPTTEQLAGMGVSPARQAGLGVTPTAQQVQAAAQAPVAGVTTTGAPQTFTEAVQRIPGEIAGRFRDPKALADMTLRAAGALAGSALAGQGLSPEEKRLLDEQTQELRQLRETNLNLFNQRLEAAQGLLGEAKYFDPEYFGLQRARKAQVAGAVAKQAGLRGLRGERAAAEARRYDIATGRNVGTQFDVGYQTGVQGRLGTMQAGLTAMPGPMSMTSGYESIRGAYNEEERRRRQREQDIGSLFGSLTGGSQSKSPGLRPPGG
jgi:hypothetical protein